MKSRANAQERLKLELLNWNNKFPCDRLYRKRHNIAYGSKEHRELSQIDIYLEFLEEELWSEAFDGAKDDIEKKKELEKGIWLRDSEADDVDVEELFNKLKVGSIKVED